MAEIIKFPGTEESETITVDPKDVLQGAIEEDLSYVIVIGYDRKGQPFAALSDNTVAYFVHALEDLKFRVLSQVNSKNKE